MKSHTIEIVPQVEIEKILNEQVANHGTESLAAKQFGVTQPEFSRARRGLSFPPRKLLDVLGLEVRRIVIRKGSK